MRENGNLEMEVDVLSRQPSLRELREISALVSPRSEPAERADHYVRLAREFSRSDEHMVLLARHVGRIAGLLHLSVPKSFRDGPQTGYITEVMVRKDLSQQEKRKVEASLVERLLPAADDNDLTIYADLDFPISRTSSIYTSRGFKRVDTKIHHLVRYPKKRDD